VLSGFIPTTKIEGRFGALAFANVVSGGQIPGPDYTITRSSILRPDKLGIAAPDPVTFFRLYDSMRQRLMPTIPFLTLPGSATLIDVNADPALSPEVMLDLNAGSTPGHNPWVTAVGFPIGTGGKNGGLIATFATGARDKTSFQDFTTEGLINSNAFICTAATIHQIAPQVTPMCSGGDDLNCFLPLEALLEPVADPPLVPVTASRFPRIGDTEVKQQLNGDGNGFMSSYLSTYPGDPNVTIVTWGNGDEPPAPPVPPAGCAAASSVPNWSMQTGYPVYHDVFYYNPNVRSFIVLTLTGSPTPPSETVITERELEELERFLNGDIFAASPPLAAAVLPSSRSVRIGGTPATVFATIANPGATPVTACRIAPLTSVPASWVYQTTDPSTNQLTGTPNTPVDIPAVGSKSFVIGITPSAAFGPGDVQIAFSCADADAAPVIPGVNTLHFSASTTSVPDVVALPSTTTADGIVSLPEPGGAGAFAVAALNLGAGDTITATADTGSATLPVVLALCRTTPATGACLAPPTSFVTGAIGSGAAATFAVFVRRTGTVSFDPATHRVFIRFTDSTGAVRGLASVAVRSVP